MNRWRTRLRLKQKHNFIAWGWPRPSHHETGVSAMKFYKVTPAVLMVIVSLQCRATPAAELQYLGFDKVDFSGFVFTNSNGVVFTNLSAGWTAKLLPGWALLADSTPVYTIGLNWHFLDTDVASLLDTSFSPAGAGKYSLEFLRAYTNS